MRTPKHCGVCAPLADTSLDEFGYVGADLEAARRGKAGWHQKQCLWCGLWYWPKLDAPATTEDTDHA